MNIDRNPDTFHRNAAITAQNAEKCLELWGADQNLLDEIKNPQLRWREFTRIKAEWNRRERMQAEWKRQDPLSPDIRLSRSYITKRRDQLLKEAPCYVATVDAIATLQQLQTGSTGLWSQEKREAMLQHILDLMNFEHLLPKDSPWRDHPACACISEFLHNKENHMELHQMLVDRGYHPNSEGKYEWQEENRNFRFTREQHLQAIMNGGSASYAIQSSKPNFITIDLEPRGIFAGFVHKHTPRKAVIKIREARPSENSTERYIDAGNIRQNLMLNGVDVGELITHGGNYELRFTANKKNVKIVKDLGYINDVAARRMYESIDDLAPTPHQPSQHHF